MSNLKHTAEPWEVKFNSYEETIAVRQKDSDPAWSLWIVEKMRPEDSADDIEQNANNAERIVKCVNACAGIEDPAAFIKLAKELMSTIKRAKQ